MGWTREAEAAEEPERPGVTLAELEGDGPPGIVAWLGRVENHQAFLHSTGLMPGLTAPRTADSVQAGVFLF